jgi:hypothetical protein
MSRILAALLLVLASPAFAYHTTTKTIERQKTIAVEVNLDVGATALADVLFVIDDSGSMQTHQLNLINNLSLLAGSLSQYQDINTAVITTSVGSMFTTKPGNGVFVGPVLNSDGSGFLQSLASQVNVGVTGDSTEKPLLAMNMALSPSLLAGANSGFIRPTADLVVFFLTDTDDQSGLVPADVYASLKTLKPNNLVTALGAMVLDPKTCSGENPTTHFLTDFIALTGGSTMSLCDDYSKALPDLLGQVKSNLEDVTLDVFPNTVVDVASLQVRLDGKVIVPGDMQNGWTFDPATNVIHLGAKLLNMKVSKLVVNYNLIKQ